MTISSKIKSLIKLQGKDHKYIANGLKISIQSFNNKLYRDSFSGNDLIKIANILDCDLSFNTVTGQRIALNERGAIE